MRRLAILATLIAASAACSSPSSSDPGRRAIEDRLVQETWLKTGYDIVPELSALRIPSLVIYSEHDFIPPDAAVHIAQAIPGARLIGFRQCGHFSYFDCPEDVRAQLDDFFGR